MFGIKTNIKNNLQNKISNDWSVQKLMKHFKVDENSHQASISKADLGYAWIHYGFIRQQKPKNLLCIGSRYGFIPSVMAQACRDNAFGHVDFVDAGFGKNDQNHWTGQAYWKSNTGLNCFKNFGLKEYIKIYVETTNIFKEKNKKKKYDYIYIDGDHSYLGVSSDAKYFWPNLNKGGYMLFHDINIKDKLPEGQYGVWKLFRKLSKNKPYLKIDLKNSGLGIIQKK